MEQCLGTRLRKVNPVLRAGPPPHRQRSQDGLGRQVFGSRSKVLPLAPELNSTPARARFPDRGPERAAIAARSLRRTFKGGIEAVRDIDLTVSGGEIFGFLGPNGAGKTTTVRMFCTLLPPSAGSASVAGLDVVGEA
ncbi:MAG: ATP-binding cassette domain-containing protein, partial [Solirubrobacterales bacterium]|nr:ATP-binding cassette domain-containing protein [Solirubrobacterales bacterium]